MTLSRGDIVLLRGPLAGTPEEVLFEGKAVFLRDRRRAQQPVLPRRRIAAQRPGAESPRPPSLPWTEKLTAEGHFERSPEGTVTLAADKATAAGWVTTPLTQAGIHEVVLEVDEATPGAGVFLGRQDDGPHEVLRFVSESCRQPGTPELQTDDGRRSAAAADRQNARPVGARQSLDSSTVRLRRAPLVDQLRRPALGPARIRAASALTGPVTTIGLHYVPKSGQLPHSLAAVDARGRWRS